MTWLNAVCFYAIMIICGVAFIPKIQYSINRLEIAKKFENFLYITIKKYYMYIIAALFVIAAGIRLWKFGIIPAGFNQDGALAAVDALALVNHGTDHFGMPYPVHFTAWGVSQMNVLLSYLSMPFFALFGMNRITARIVSLIVSMLALWVLYKMGNMVFGKKAGIAILAFCAINPWQIMQSRWALESNMFPHFLLFSIYFLYMGLRRNRRFLYLSMVFFGITMYSYGIAWYSIPLLLAATCIYLYIRKELKIKETIGCFLTFMFISWPIFAVAIINILKHPSINAAFFTIPFFPDTVRTSDILFFSPNVFLQLINNIKTTINIAILQKPDLPWNSIPEYGTLYLFSLPVAVVGFIILIKKRNDDSKESVLKHILLIWFIIATISGFIANNVNINRINLILYPLIIMCGIGIFTIIRKVKLLGIFLAMIYVAGFIAFSSSYFGPHSKVVAESFYEGFGETLEYAESMDYDRIYITNWTQSENSWWVSEPLTLFHSKIDALYFQGKADAVSKSGKKLQPYKERYKYVHFSEFNITPAENAAYVISSKEAAYFNRDLFNFKPFGSYIAVLPKVSNTPLNDSNSNTYQNLLTNPSFENGMDTDVQGWSINTWDKAVGASEIKRDSNLFKSGASSIHMINNKPNDTRMEQNIIVEPDSLYIFSCWVRTKNVGANGKGANLSFSGLFASTKEIKGTNDKWEYVELYGKTDKNQKALTLTVGLGGYGSINTGEVWFDDVSVRKAAALPANTEAVELYNTTSKTNRTYVYGYEMIYYSVFYILLILVVYLLISKGLIKLPASKNRTVLYLLAGIGLITRIFLAQRVEGLPNDIACFKGWAIAAAENLPGIYNSGIFLDYPPFYLYILFIIGKIASIPGLNADLTLLVKLPPILADVATAFIVYYLVEKKIKPGFGYIAAAVFLFNPAIILNSSLWGMVDSFFMLLVICAILLVINRKVEYSVIFFAASVLMKPQGVFFLPVLLFALIKYKSLKKLFLVFVYGLTTTIIILLPFFSINDPLWIFKLFIKTGSYYKFASMNAYNLFSLLGANMKGDSSTLLIFSYGTWGWIFDILLLLFSGFIFFRYKNSAAPILSALILNAGAFVLSSRMHERYIYPAVILSLMLFIFIKDKRIPIIFSIFTFTTAMNMHDVLFRALNSIGAHIPANDPVLIIFSLVNVLTLAGLIIISISLVKKDSKVLLKKY